LAIFGGVGFTIAIVIMAGIREELDLCDVPKPFKGAAITLIVAGILAMGFMGFTGVDSGLKKALTAGRLEQAAVQGGDTAVARRAKVDLLDAGCEVKTDIPEMERTI
jgi:electron transport complex protein RnfA